MSIGESVSSLITIASMAAIVIVELPQTIAAIVATLAFFTLLKQL